MPGSASIDILLREGDASTFRDCATTNPIRAADLLEPELSRFEDYMVGRKMDPLGRYEKQILREYLGFKLVQLAPLEADAG